MKPQTMLMNLHDVKIHDIRVNAQVRVTIADQGIGAYEFHGMKGIDSRMGIDEMEIVEAEYCEGQEVLTQMSAKAWLNLDQNFDELVDRACDQWEADRDSYDEPDCDDD